MARTTCLVCFFSTVNSRSKKEEKTLVKTGAISGYITNLKQSIYFWRLSISMVKCFFRVCLRYRDNRSKLVRFKAQN